MPFPPQSKTLQVANGYCNGSNGTLIANRTPETESQQRRIAEAALSHLELALLNAKEQANQFHAEDKLKLLSTSRELQFLAMQVHFVAKASSSEAPADAVIGTSNWRQSFEESLTLPIGAERGSEPSFEERSRTAEEENANGPDSVATEKAAMIKKWVPPGLQRAQSNLLAKAQDWQCIAKEEKPEFRRQPSRSTESSPTSAKNPLKNPDASLSATFTSQASKQINAVDLQLQFSRQSTPQEIHDSDHGLEMNELQLRLMELFNQLDTDKSGTIDRHELQKAFNMLELTEKDFDTFIAFDETGDGRIDRVEWLHLIERYQAASGCDANVFLNALIAKQSKTGKIYDVKAPKKPCCIIWHDSTLRITWDLCMLILLAYVSITLPVGLAFDRGNGELDDIATFGYIVDWLFCLDIVFNFRTTFKNGHDQFVAVPSKIAVHYLKTWFFLDLVSSVPLDQLTASVLPNVRVARLLKVGKIMKVLKMLRLSKMTKFGKDSDGMEDFMDCIVSAKFQSMLTLSYTMLLLLLGSHWFACLLVWADGTCLKEYQNVMEGGSIWPEYLAAVYWAMMVMTTVGFGDITPQNDMERGITMIAMIVGGMYYSYVVASMTAIVGAEDATKNQQKECLDVVHGWLNFHQEIPTALRRRIRKHFKNMLKKRKILLEDTAIMNDLTPELNQDVAYFLLHDDIRNNPLFEDVHPILLSRLVPILERLEYEGNETIVDINSEAEGMFIIHEGIALMKDANLWARGSDASGAQNLRRLLPGYSFGEEVLCGLDDKYAYSVVAKGSVRLFKISAKGLRDALHDMPQMMELLKRTCLETSGSTIVRTLGRPGHSSLLIGGNNGMPSSFPDEIFGALRDLNANMKELQGGTKVVEETWLGTEHRWRHLGKQLEPDPS